MTGKETDHFVEKLKELMGQIPDGQRSEMLIHIGKIDARMRRNGQLRPTWSGPMPEKDILGKEVVVPTAAGTQVGQVVYFGIHQDGAVFERSVYAIVPSSGTMFEAPGSLVRVAGMDDLDRMRRELDMAKKIEQLETEEREAPKKRRKHERDPIFVQKLVDLALEAGLSVERMKTFHKVTGSAKNRAVYVAVEALRCDLSGFSVEHPAIKSISAEEAKEQHLGAVRGTISFDNRELAEEAFVEALGGLL